MSHTPHHPIPRRALLAAPFARLLAPQPSISAAIPAGNILVQGREDAGFRILQDLRDTEGDWFWWCFDVRHAAAATLRFTFTGSDVIGTRGPACSTDGGLTWRWLGRQCVEGKSFVHQFDPAAPSTRFAFAMSYTALDLRRFLRGSTGLRLSTLCRTRKGRAAELLRFGSTSANARKVLLTARHHCCESMASFALEGLIEAALDNRWLRQNAAFLVVPFVDKDGVEDGDQGKNRRPRDHNRDYDGASLHPTVAAIRALVPQWSAGRLDFALDMHCPWIRGPHNEAIYFPGVEDPRAWAAILRFARLLEAAPGPGLPYSTADNLPFGAAWNTAANYSQGMSFARWAAALPGTLAAGAIEIPYANCGDTDVTPASARLFGHRLAAALSSFLRG